MQQLIEFVSNHLLLTMAFVVILALLVRSFISDSGGKFSVDPVKATELINRQEAIVVDVRPEADFRKGHIINAVNIPISQFSTQMNKLNKFRDRPIIVSCRSGASSQTACKQLRGSGHEQVYNLQGGMMAWESASLPVSK